MEKENKIDVTVALPTWENKDIIWLQLESLCKQETQYKWELVVCEEQTENMDYVPHAKRDIAGGHEIANIYLPGQHRDTTTHQYIGNSSASSSHAKQTSYSAAYNSNLNPNKEVVSKVDRFNAGSQSLFNADQNVVNLRNKCVNESQLFVNMPKGGSSIGNYGELSGKNTREKYINPQRNTSELLDAFNNNPYSQSLHSSA